MVAKDFSPTLAVLVSDQVERMDQPYLLANMYGHGWTAVFTCPLVSVTRSVLMRSEIRSS